MYYFLSKDDFPKKAKSVLKAAIVGVFVYAIAALIFFFLVLPIEKRLLLKYECTTNNPGATYDMNTYTCTHKDGTKDVKMPK